MSTNITDTFQKKYTTKWGNVLQQHTSLLEKCTTFAPQLSGSVVFFDQFGLIDFEEKTSRISKTILDEAPTERRCMRPRMFTKAIGFDEFDGTQMESLDEPLCKTLDNLRSAASRRMDDVMIQGFLGTNYTGEDGLNAVELGDEQTIKADHVESGTAAASNLTVAKLRATMQKFQEKEAWNDDSRDAGDQLVIAVTSSQIMSLLREKEVTSYDFNNLKALVHGEIETFMGFRFIRTQRLPKDKNGNRINLAWVKSKAQYGLWDDYKVKISIRDDMDEALQVRARFACGATRLQEEGFMRILCDESK